MFLTQEQSVLLIALFAWSMSVTIMILAAEWFSKLKENLDKRGLTKKQKELN